MHGAFSSDAAATCVTNCKRLFGFETSATGSIKCSPDLRRHDQSQRRLTNGWRGPAHPKRGRCNSRIDLEPYTIEPDIIVHG